MKELHLNSPPLPLPHRLRHFFLNLVYGSGSKEPGSYMIGIDLAQGQSQTVTIRLKRTKRGKLKILGMKRGEMP